MTTIIIVTAAFDAAKAEWSATSDDLAGLRLVADSWTDLVERLPGAARERLRETCWRRRDVSIEVLLHTSLNVSVDAIAKCPVGTAPGLQSSVHSPA